MLCVVCTPSGANTHRSSGRVSWQLRQAAPTNLLEKSCRNTVSNYLPLQGCLFAPASYLYPTSSPSCSLSSSASGSFSLNPSPSPLRMLCLSSVLSLTLSAAAHYLYTSIPPRSFSPFTSCPLSIYTPLLSFMLSLALARTVALLPALAHSLYPYPSPLCALLTLCVFSVFSLYPYPSSLSALLTLCVLSVLSRTLPSPLLVQAK